MADGAQPNSKEGVYIEGFFIEGAKWDKLDECLLDADPMKLIGDMPKFHVKAVEKEKKGKKRKGKGKDGLKYMCPCYYYPTRRDTVEDPSFMFSVPLKSGKGGKVDPNFARVPSGVVFASEEDCLSKCGRGRWQCVQRNVTGRVHDAPQNTYVTNYCQPNATGACADRLACEQFCSKTQVQDETIRAPPPISLTPSEHRKSRHTCLLHTGCIGPSV